MQKKHIVLSALVIVLIMVVTCLLYSKFLVSNIGFNITINNKTTIDINILSITYNHAENDIKVPVVKSNSSFLFNVTPKEDFSESSMKLYYEDKNGKIHEEQLIGYFEKGYSCNVYIDINSVSKEGVLDLDVKNDLEG